MNLTRVRNTGNKIKIRLCQIKIFFKLKHRYPLRFLTYPIHSTLFFGTISSITAILNKIITIVQLITNSTNQKIVGAFELIGLRGSIAK